MKNLIENGGKTAKYHYRDKKKFPGKNFTKRKIKA